jgi:hypothetical protein
MKLCGGPVRTFAIAALFSVGANSDLLAATDSKTPPCRVSEQVTDIESSRQPRISVLNSTLSGDPLSLKWSVPEPRPNGDAYLIIGFPEETRFRGDGFVALQPKARAPRSLKSHEEETRLVVPLTGDLANLNGAAEAIFFESGLKKIQWEIVDIDSAASCRETIRAQGEATVTVRLGAPQIFPQNAFEEDQPLRTLTSNDKRFLIREFANRFQVIESVSGNRIFERAGTSPRFSPTGRFVTSNDSSKRFEVSDLLAQKVVFSDSDELQGNFGGANIIAWMNNDSILVLGACPNSRCSILSESDSTLGYEQVFSPLEYR